MNIGLVDYGASSQINDHEQFKELLTDYQGLETTENVAIGIGDGHTVGGHGHGNVCLRIYPNRLSN